MKVLMPSFGMTMQEGTIGKWLKGDGDEVQKGEVIVEITTEKLTNEVEAPETGTLRILAKEGDIIECGGDIAEIE